MFITVLYGDSKSAIFNPNCKTTLLLENIRQRCHCNNDIQVDLSDTSGNVKHLLEAPYRYAIDLLSERETCVLLKVEKNEDQKPEYTPLLNDGEAINEAFLARLSTKEKKSHEGSAKGPKKKAKKEDRGRDTQRQSRSGSKSTTPTGRRGRQR